MSHGRFRRIASALLGLALAFGLTLGQITPPATHGGDLPTISTLSDDPGSDPGGGG